MRINHCSNFCCGPDLFGVSLANVTPGSASGLLTTFSNLDADDRSDIPVSGVLQSYPSAYPNLPGSPPFSGAAEVGTLGYNFLASVWVMTTRFTTSR